MVLVGETKRPEETPLAALLIPDLDETASGRKPFFERLMDLGTMVIAAAEPDSGDLVTIRKGQFLGTGKHPKPFHLTESSVLQRAEALKDEPGHLWSAFAPNRLIIKTSPVDTYNEALARGIHISTGHYCLKLMRNFSKLKHLNTDYEGFALAAEDFIMLGTTVNHGFYTDNDNQQLVPRGRKASKDQVPTPSQFIEKYFEKITAGSRIVNPATGLSIDSTLKDRLHAAAKGLHTKSE